MVTEFRSTHKLDFSAGFPNKDYAPRPDWGASSDEYIQFADSSETVKAGYLRLVGGTTWHWSSASIRFLPSDFKMKSQYGLADDWPISYQELEPYYSQAENEMGVSGAYRKVSENDERSAPFPMQPMPHSYMENQIIEPLEKHTELRFDPKPVA